MTDEQAAQGTVDYERDSATVRFERNYTRPPSEVWSSITDPLELANWLAASSVDLRVGGEFVVRFDDGTMNGRITELEPERLIAYSWHEGEERESHVRWELSPTPAGTKLVLTHRKLARRSASGFAAGWHHHLERLSGLLAGTPVGWRPERFEELEGMYSRASRTPLKPRAVAQ